MFRPKLLGFTRHPFDSPVFLQFNQWWSGHAKRPDGKVLLFRLAIKVMASWTHSADCATLEGQRFVVCDAVEREGLTKGSATSRGPRSVTLGVCPDTRILFHYFCEGGSVAVMEALFSGVRVAEIHSPFFVL